MYLPETKPCDVLSPGVYFIEISASILNPYMAQFSLYVHKGGLKPDSFHFISLTLTARGSTLVVRI